MAARKKTTTNKPVKLKEVKKTELEKVIETNKTLTTTNIQLQFKVGELNGEIRGLKSTIEILINKLENKQV